MSLAKHSIADQTHKLVYPIECSRTSYRPASHNNPDWPKFAATRPRLQRRQGYEKSRRHINHAHKVRPFAHDSSQSIDHDNTRVVTRTSVEKPHTHDKSMNETEIIVNTHASGLYAVNESHYAYRLT